MNAGWAERDYARDIKPLLIGTHGDSVIDTPCADDNAAAIPMALPPGDFIAAQGSLSMDVIIAIFAAEEALHFPEPSERVRKNLSFQPC